MRMKKNKKGFSLVELMIVVVIMGILIAVAVPLYGSITKNAEKNTCQNNQREIVSVFAKWVLMDENNSPNSFFSSGTSFNAKTQSDDVLPADFLASFDDNKLPSCPDEENYYVISLFNSNSIKVECYHKTDDAFNTEHANSNG